MNDITLIKSLSGIKFFDTLTSVLLILLSLLALKRITEEVCRQLDIEIWWMKDRREKEEFLRRIESLELQCEEDAKKSIAYDEKIQGSVQELTLLLKLHIQKDNECTIATFRSTLWRIYDDFMEKGYITREGLKTFIECGKVYQAAGGDDIYHTKLEPDILSLPIKENNYINKLKY